MIPLGTEAFFGRFCKVNFTVSNNILVTIVFIIKKYLQLNFMVSLMSSLSQFTSLSLRVFRIWRGAGHRDSFSRGHFSVQRPHPERKTGSLPGNSTHQGDCSHCDVPK